MTNADITMTLDAAKNMMNGYKGVMTDLLEHISEFDSIEFENAVMKDEIETMNAEIKTQLQSLIDEIDSI